MLSSCPLLRLKKVVLLALLQIPVSKVYAYENTGGGPHEEQLALHF
jgi:hypothetical protein